MWAVLTPVLYVLSIGPTWWLVRKGFIPDEVGLIYYPFHYLPDWIVLMIEAYRVWWTP